MVNPVLLIGQIESNLEEIRLLLGPGEAAAFENRYHELSDLLLTGEGLPEAAGKQLLDLVNSYPAIAQILLRSSPELLAPPAGPSTAHAGESGGETEGRKTETDSKQGVITMANPSNIPERTSGLFQWNTEQFLQILKEGVTAFLAVILVIYTMRIAQSTFTYVGDQQKMSDAKDVLLLLLGLAGAVIGYYFGRVPSDARAAQAQQQAAAATSQSEQISAEAALVAEEMEQILNRMAPNGAAARRGEAGAPAGVTLEEWERIRQDVRQLASMARRRF